MYEYQEHIEAIAGAALQLQAVGCCTKRPITNFGHVAGSMSRWRWRARGWMGACAEMAGGRGRKGGLGPREAGIRWMN